MAGKRFHWRSFVTFTLFFALFWILVSGTVLYIAPPGRVAHWQQWKILGLDKDQWQAQHTLFSYLFFVSALFHIFMLNWRNLWSYVKIKSKAGFRKFREFILAIFLFLIVFFGTLYDVPPFVSFFNLGDEIGFSWENKMKRAPVPHTENLTLREIATDYLNMDSDDAVGFLEQNGISATPDQSLKEIAQSNRRTPADIYGLLSNNYEKGMKPGGGYGRMTIREIAKELGVSSETIIKHLNRNDIQVGESDTVRQIAAKYNMHPGEVVRLIRSGLD